MAGIPASPSGPNGRGPSSDDEAQARIAQMTAPRPMMVAYTVVVQKFTAPDKPEAYFAEEILRSANGEFCFYWDETGCKQRAVTFRAAAAQMAQLRSGLIVPPPGTQVGDIGLPPHGSGGPN